MAQPYIGEIRMFASTFPPVGWLFCDGQLLPISENDALFTLIGTTYGGDGQSTFALPDLRGRVPMHFGQGPAGVNHTLAEASGVEEVTLTAQQIPVHNHAAIVSTNPATDANPGGNLIGSSPSINFFIEGTEPDASLLPQAVTPVGGSQPHTNIQPYLCVNFIISLFGLFPSQT
ncbi:MAG TPA: tail fiber protein [Allosphingosinicella sp.]|jgi:microcystin-dependent protein